MKKPRDDSILAWNLPPIESSPTDSRDMRSASVFATSLDEFVYRGHVAPRKLDTKSTSAFAVDGGCIRINISLFTAQTGQLFGLLNCGPRDRNTKEVIAIALGDKLFDETGEYIRPQGRCPVLIPRFGDDASTKPIYIRTERQETIATAFSYQNCFYIEDTVEASLELVEVEPEDRWGKDLPPLVTGNDSADDIAQQTWALFRPVEQHSSDFLVLLEFESRGIASGELLPHDDTLWHYDSEVFSPEIKIYKARSTWKAKCYQWHPQYPYDRGAKACTRDVRGQIS